MKSESEVNTGTVEKIKLKPLFLARIEIHEIRTGTYRIERAGVKRPSIYLLLSLAAQVSAFLNRSR